MQIEQITDVWNDRGGWRLGVLYAHAHKNKVRVLDTARLTTRTINRKALLTQPVKTCPRHLRIVIEKTAKTYRRLGVSHAGTTARQVIAGLRELEGGGHATQ